MQPVSVSISKTEYENADCIEGIQKDKKKAVDLYIKYGAGREYKGTMLNN